MEKHEILQFPWHRRILGQNCKFLRVSKKNEGPDYEYIFQILLLNLDIYETEFVFGDGATYFCWLRFAWGSHGILPKMSNHKMVYECAAVHVLCDISV